MVNDHYINLLLSLDKVMFRFIKCHKMHINTKNMKNACASEKEETNKKLF